MMILYKDTVFMVEFNKAQRVMDMARPLGQKNLIPSQEDQRRFLKGLREKAEQGSPEAAGFLVMISTLKALADQVGREVPHGG